MHHPSQHQQRPPWKHVAQAYTWVIEQESRVPPPVGKRRRGQESRDPEERAQRSQSLRARMLKALSEAYHSEYIRGVQLATSVRREKLRKAEAAAEQERRKHVERQDKARLLEKDKERRRTVDESWNVYTTRWRSIDSPHRSTRSSRPLTFSTIPWPVVSPPSRPSSLTLRRIAAFLFASTTGEKVSRKERIRAALLRWHPDRFRRVLARVEDRVERERVDEAVGIVARCLNELLAREKERAEAEKNASLRPGYFFGR